jgi:hypothetical protein
MADDVNSNQNDEPTKSSPWRLTGWLCFSVIATSVILTVALSAYRSTGLTRIKVTAIDADAEPRDHQLPLFKQKQALPDYQVLVILREGGYLNLGTKPDRSAVGGLDWSLGSPVSLSDIASIRLQDDDKLVSDVVAEVQIDGEEVADGNYRFEFHTQRSIEVGIQSFFQTAIGKAILAAFFVAVFLMLFEIFWV